MRYESGDLSIISIGRDPGSAIVFQDKGVSRNHCSIETRTDGWYLSDAGSTNGTLLNSVLIKKENNSSVAKQLRTGDLIGVGVAVLRVEISPDVNLDKTEIIEPKVTPDATIFVPAKSTLSKASGMTSSHPMRAQQTAFAKVSTVSNPLKADSKQNDLLNELFSTDESDSVPTLPIQSVGLKLPCRFHQFQLEEKIGEGGIGEVFLAKRINGSDEKLAIKFLRVDRMEKEQDRKRFFREMEISMTLKHASLVECFESGEQSGILFLVMEYCSGGNLSDLLKRNGKLTLRRALRLADRLLSGLEMAHSLNFVHRDLKPSNILLQRDQLGKYHPKICDFGLAKNFMNAGSSGMTVDGSVGGSWPYMPREQFTDFRFVAPQSDVWSLAAILYECISGVLPRPMNAGCDPIQVILNATASPITEYIDVPSSISQFLEQALAISTAERYSTAGEMRQALHAAVKIAKIQI